jgi:phosphatidylserine/phosphatidylglycerophosphate/cardiolipin synthase-like enzyme
MLDAGAYAGGYSRRRSFLIAFHVLALALAGGGCAATPPPDAVRAPNGLQTVMETFGVRPLNPDSGTPLVRQTLAELEKTDPRGAYRGTTYRLTEGNRLPRGWLLQTPNVWGKAAADVPFFPIDCTDCDPDFRLPECTSNASCGAGTCMTLAASVAHPRGRPRKFCVGHSDAILDTFYAVIVSAQHAVDLALLQPPADTRFLAALRNAVTRLAYSGHAVTMRVIVGDHPPEGTDAAAFLQELARDAMHAPNSRLRLFVGAMRSCSGEAHCNGALSWSHAKNVAVDGRRAIVGGHNMWSPDYLADAPVHDLSMQVEGPAAADAHRFSDALWGYLCRQERTAGVNEWHSDISGKPGGDADCPARIDLPDGRRQAGPGGVPVLSVGRLAAGITTDFADQSLVARDLMFGAAKQTIRILTQDVPFAVVGLDLSWPEGALDKIAALIADKRGDAFLVLSNAGAAGPVGTYSMMVRLETVAWKIRDTVRQRSKLDEQALTGLLCRRLHLAPLRFGPDATWQDDAPIGTHAKFWMVDERAFHIGAENLYPTELQEFGYIVEDRAAAAQARRDYWDQAWKWSKAAAISGEGAPTCIFTEPRPAA